MASIRYVEYCLFTAKPRHANAKTSGHSAGAAPEKHPDETKSAPAFRLLDLPKELRLIIYDFVLAENNRIIIRLSGRPCKPVLLQINQQVASEALSAYKRVARFHIHADGLESELSAYLQSLGQEKLASIRKLKVSFRFSPGITMLLRYF